jgi:hypothetical protein
MGHPELRSTSKKMAGMMPAIPAGRMPALRFGVSKRRLLLQHQRLIQLEV